MKTTKAITATMILFVILFYACTGASNGKKEGNGQNDPQAGTVDSQATPKAQAQQILAAYLEIKDALVETNGEAASTAAAGLVSALGESNDELVEKIRSDVEHIAETKDANHQRDHFNTLSDNVYAMIQAVPGIVGSGEPVLYRQYCPMAMNNNGAYWLSAEKEVNNPYFGDKMLHCGSVKETIK